MSKRVILIGGSTRSTDRIDDDGAELWSCNNLYTLCKTLELEPTRWFEIHHITRVKDVYYRRFVPTVGAEQPIKDYLLELKALKIPVYMQKHWPIIPRSISYPLQDVLARFPRAYFNNSFAYMLALAIMEKFEEIEIYGIGSPLETMREYLVHILSTEYLLGYAEALDIKVTVGHISDLLKCPLYGYAEQPGDYQDWQAREPLVSSAREYINMWRL